jgi:hypothetical protein
MATINSSDARQIDGCPYAVVSDARPPRPLQLESHRWLHEDGQRLITTWFERAWAQRGNDEATFEAFIFAWMSVNAWAACVTGEDQDRAYMRRLQVDEGLRKRFLEVVRESPEVRHHAEEFMSLLPIFKAQRLRRAGVRGQAGMTRTDLVRHYFAAGVSGFEPECAE